MDVHTWIMDAIHNWIMNIQDNIFNYIQPKFSFGYML